MDKYVFLSIFVYLSYGNTIDDEETSSENGSR